MRFIIGLLFGFLVGIAGAILFAPDKNRNPSRWPEGHPARSRNGDAGAGVDGANGHGLRGTLRTLQDHVNQAWEEARSAAEEAEHEMMARYAVSAGKPAPQAASGKKRAAQPAGSKKK